MRRHIQGHTERRDFTTPAMPHQKNPRRRLERGSIAPLMLGLMVVLLTLSLGLLSLTESQSKMVVDDGKRLAAMNLAEGGIDHIIWRMRQPNLDEDGEDGPGWRNVADEQDVDLGSGVYHLVSMDTTLAAGVKGIRMQGCVPNRTASNAVCSEIYSELGPVYWKPWIGAALGDKGVTVDNGATDSYNSSEGAYGVGPVYQNGDVATNSKIAASINIKTGNILGKAYYPSGASPLVVSGADKVSGGVGPNPADSEYRYFPPVPADAIYLQPIKGGILRTTSGVVLSQPLSPGVYVVTADPSTGKSVTIKGGETINVQGTGETIFFLQGDAEIAGNGIANGMALPPNLQVYGMKPNPSASPSYPGCLNIDIGGNGEFHGAIYAPQATIKLNGAGKKGAVFGSVAGKVVEFKGTNPEVHYDESLRDLPGVISGYRLNTWTQTK